jgi:disulfide bond formation protein DsbB
MQIAGPLDALPLWALFIFILLVVLLSVECGYRLGKYRRGRREQEKEAPVGTMFGATLGLRLYPSVHVWIGSQPVQFGWAFSPSPSFLSLQ